MLQVRQTDLPWAHWTFRFTECCTLSGCTSTLGTARKLDLRTPLDDAVQRLTYTYGARVIHLGYSSTDHLIAYVRQNRIRSVRVFG